MAFRDEKIKQTHVLFGNEQLFLLTIVQILLDCIY